MVINYFYILFILCFPDMCVKILGIVPAKGVSRGIPKKNLRILEGKPLVTYAIEAIVQAKSINRAIVSTDDPTIAKVAQKIGAEVPFLRPKYLCKPTVSLIPVIQHAMKFLDKQNWRADIVVSVQPTSPLISSDEVDRAVTIMKKYNCDSVISVSRIKQNHPFWSMEMKNGKLYPLFPWGFKYLQRQDLPTLYFPTGGIYVRKRHLLEKWDGKDFALGKHVRALVLDEIKAIDINTAMDLLVAKVMKKYGHNKKLKEFLHKEFPIFR